MARRQNYPDELLLEAVIKYAQIYLGKIKAAALAIWADKNIDGLSGVCGYHFMRPIKKKDKVTGEVVEILKECTLKIIEINKSRDIISQLENNPLFKSSNVDEFLHLQKSIQRSYILKARNQFEKVMQKNKQLEWEKKELHVANNTLKKELTELLKSFDEVMKKQEILDKQVKYLMAHLDEQGRRDALGKIGVSSEGFDLSTYMNSIRINQEKVFSIKTLLREQAEIEFNDSFEIIAERDSCDNMIENIISGINFD